MGRDWAWGEWPGGDRKGSRAELCTPAWGLRDKAAQHPGLPAALEASPLTAPCRLRRAWGGARMQRLQSEPSPLPGQQRWPVTPEGLKAGPIQGPLPPSCGHNRKTQTCHCWRANWGWAGCCGALMVTSKDV